MSLSAAGSVTDTDTDEIGSADGDASDLATEFSLLASSRGALERRLARYAPVGLEPLGADGVVVVHAIAADNFVNRGLGKWDVPSLKALAKMLPGLPFQANHDWYDVESVAGTILRAVTLQLENPPEWALDRAGNKALNKMAIERDGGYFATVTEMVVPTSMPILNTIRAGAFAVSLGGFAFSDFVCPLCDCSFFEERCPHRIPDYFYREGDEQYAPFYIRSGVYDLGELSLVAIPNLPAAGILRAFQFSAFENAKRV